MSKPVKIEHVLKGWEKKYGYIALSPKEREFFAAVKGERFMLSISGKPDYQRKIDDSWRIYISAGAFEDLETSDVLIISKDKKRNYYVKKKK